MASIIERAAKGQRNAMNTLYEANKQKVYFVAHSLLMNPEQAASATVSAFRETWADLRFADISTEKAFTNHVLCRAIDYCKGKSYKKNPKALRIPLNKNFTLPTNLMVNDTHDDELDYLLANLPSTHRYIFVMYTAGEMEPAQIGRSLKFDSKTVRTAIEAQEANVARLQHLSAKGYSCTYAEILEGIKQKEANTVVPASVDGQAAAVIDGIATPAEEKAKKRSRRICIVSALVCACALIAAMVFGLISRDTDTAGSEETTAATEDTSAVTDGTDEDDGSETTIELLDETLTYYADIAIADYGTVTVMLDQASAPITCANFVSLAESGFYDGLTFHRIKEGFVMQGGDPEGDGTGGSSETITGEFSANGYDNPLSHTRGAISMARSDDYDSASSQFFIVHEDSSDSLDGLYAVFGYVVDGMDVVDAVCEAAEPTDDNGTIASDAQPVITSVTIRTMEAE